MSPLSLHACSTCRWVRLKGEKLLEFLPEIERRATEDHAPKLAPRFSDTQHYDSNLVAHSSIPHNGIAAISQFIRGTYDVFGMGLDLGAFLTLYGAVFDGDLTKWSIGGSPPASLVSSIGVLGQAQGIIGSHNKYESDVSPTRPNLYNGRFQQSINNNKYFFNGPFSRVAVLPADYTCIYRFMSNKSEQNPEGYLDGEVLKPFFGTTGRQSDRFVWNEGQEKIPNNWYKHAIGDEYTIPFFSLDLNSAALQYPQFLDVGGKTGEVDSLTGVDAQDLTGGVFNSTTLLDGNNAACFAFQFTQQVASDVLKGLFSAIIKPLDRLNQAVSNGLSGFACPPLKAIDTKQLGQFPSAKGAY